MKKMFTPYWMALGAGLALVQAAQLVCAAVIHPGTALVEEAPLRAHLAFLSSDLLEGRGTGQRGGELTMAYLEAQARALGLQPADGNSYRQPVQIAGTKALPQHSSVHLESGRQPLALNFGDDWVWNLGDAQPEHQFDNEVVFVGYGISAPEENWDDYKAVDCNGKVLIMMVNDPQATEQEPERFGGKALTYYGRWSYKYEEAKRRGAAGVLLIHTDASATYGWSVVKNGGTSESFQLSGGKGGNRFQGWLSEAAARRLFSAAGQDLDSLRAAAERKDFTPVRLAARLKGQAKSTVRKIEQFNIAGIVPGSDAQLKDELVIYSAHWDHLGKQEGTGDVIYNGAVDNASGSAGLLAMAKAALAAPAKRSQMFLWVAAEEQGLLGSAAYAANPLWPLAKTAANLNLDALNFIGMTRDIGVQGSERSELGGMAAKVAQQMQMQIAPAKPDLGGGYFRSDHFSFAKAGVPAFSVGSGRDFISDPQAAAAKSLAYRQRYHQVSDEYDPSWDLSGMRQQAQFTLNLGRAIADAAVMPGWKNGDPFGQLRKK